MVSQLGGSLVGELGTGGMGQVFEVSLPEGPTPVACKVAQGETEGFAWQRLRREAQVTALVKGPGVPEVFESGHFEDGRPWFTMSAVRGMALSKRSKYAVSEQDRLALVPAVLAVARTLSRAHDMGVVHRDVNASNVIVGPGGETTLIDWGLARAFKPEAAAVITEDSLGNSGESTAVGTRLGTPVHMSPEQVAGERVDSRADVWALGIMLWQILAGKPAYEGLKTADVFKAILGGPPPMQPIEWAPEHLQRVVRESLAPLADRISNAGAMADALMERRANHRERVRRVGANRWVITALAGAGGLALGAAIANWPTLAGSGPSLPPAAAMVMDSPDEGAGVVAEAALASLLTGDRYRADMLVLDALRRGADPSLRGLLWSSMSRPTLLLDAPIKGCDIGELLREDGRAVACADVGSTASWWIDDDGVQERWRRDFESHHVQFYGDDGIVSVVPKRHRIELYTAEKGTYEHRIAERAGFTCRSENPNRLLVLGATRELWDIGAKKQVAETPAPCSTRFCLLASDNTEWYGCENELKRVDSQGEVLQTYPLASPGYVQSMRHSPNGRYVVAVGYGDTGVMIDTKTGERTPFSVGSNHTATVAVSNDGRRVAVNADNGTSVLDPTDRARQTLLPIPVAQLAFDDTGVLVALSTSRAQRWRLPDDLALWKAPGSIRNLAWLNSGMVALLRDRTAWKHSGDGTISKLAEGVSAMAARPGFDEVALGLVSNGFMLAGKRYAPNVTCDAMGWLDSDRVVCASRSGGPLLVDVRDGKVDPSRSMPGQSWHELRGAGAGLVMMEWSGTLWTLDGDGRAQELVAAPDATNAVRSSDGRYIAVAHRREVRIMEASTKRLLHSLPVAVRVARIEFSPDGRHLATRDGSGSVRIYRAPSFELIAHLEPSGIGVWSMVWSPDSSRLAFAVERDRIAAFSLSDLERPLSVVAEQTRLAWGQPGQAP